MSVVCQKDYTITINPLSLNLTAYWTCDSVAPVSFDLVDSVTGLHLFYISGIANPTPPGLISNGIQRTPGFNASFDSGNVARLAYPNTGGMSFFGWFKIITPDTCAIGPELNLNTGAANITIEIANTNNPQNLHVYWNDANSQTNDLYFPVTTGAFHFFHLFFDPVAQKFGVSIDNGAPTLDGTGVAFAVTPTGEFNFTGPIASTVADVIWDELGIKLDRKLTSAEQTFLYHSGAGRTWPL